MKRLTLTGELSELFQPDCPELELRDAAGVVLGHFVPACQHDPVSAGGNVCRNGACRQLIVDEPLRSRLCGLKESLELVDTCGRVIGHILPVQDRSIYRGVNSPTDRQELLRRAGEVRGRTWAEIRADLEKIA